MKLIIAIDAGASGGYAIGTIPYADSLRLENWTGEAAFLDELEGLQSADLPLEAWLEEVPPFVGRKIPASSSFKLGNNYGWIRGAVQGRGIPLNLVRPAVWQAGLTGVRQRQGSEKKRCLRDHAVRLYPTANRRITLKTADAVLVFHYARTQNP